MHLKSYPQLFETTYKNVWFSLYHGSNKRMKLGTIITSRSDGYTSMESEREIEDLFEKYKPANKISRKNCVYMVSNPDDIDAAGGYSDYIYMVNPIGPIDKSDLSWYAEVDGLLHDKNKNIKIIKSYINNYWTGVQYKTKEHSLFEYRANSAKIIEIV